MTDDVLARIDDTLTFYSAGLGEELTVRERRLPDQVLAVEAARYMVEVVVPTMQRVFDALVPIVARAVEGFQYLTQALGPLLHRESPRQVRVARRARRAELRQVRRRYVQHRRDVSTRA